MELLTVETQRVKLTLANNGGRWGPNRVDLLTGPNGCGKTEVLTALAGMLRGSKVNTRNPKVSWLSGQTRFDTNAADFASNGPRRVIAQTFSPFTRFPPSVDSNISLTSIYSEGQLEDLRYVCAGLHRSTRMVGAGLSKRTLEQAIYRLSEAPEGAKTIFQVMNQLGLQDRFVLTYELRAPLRELITLRSVDEIVRQLLEQFSERTASPNVARTGFSAELRRTNFGELRPLLTEALLHLIPRLESERRFTHDFSAGSRIASEDFVLLQSLALLRRLDLLTLKHCELVDIKHRSMLDVASTSSGQQQMLCSVIGLATALSRESLVLIDEPELSLHPRWQLTYLEHLQAALMPFEGCHVLIATHSPLIVQKGLSMGAGVIQMGVDVDSEMMVERHGDSVDGTLVNVFDTPVQDSTYLANQLFSTITDAESGSAQVKENSKNELLRLKKLYSDPEIGDEDSVHLIDGALELLAFDEAKNG